MFGHLDVTLMYYKECFIKLMCIFKTDKTTKFYLLLENTALKNCINFQ